MLKPVAMAKVAVVGPKDQLGPTVNALHELNVLHIEDYTPGEAGFDLGSPLPEGAPVSERLLRVRGLLKSAQLRAPAATIRFTPETLRGLQSQLAEVEVELSQLVDRRDAWLDEAKALDEEQAALRRIESFPLALELAQGYRTLATAAGFVPAGTDLDVLRAVHPNLESTTSAEAEGTFLFVAAPKIAERALLDALNQIRFQPIELPPGPGTPAARLARLADENARLAAQAAEAESQIAALRERHAPAFYALDEYLAIEAEKSTAPVRFRTTRNSFMVEGWVPRDELARLKSVLGTATHSHVFVTELPNAVTQPWKHDVAPAGASGHEHAEGHAGHAPEMPPVELRNPNVASPYALLTDTYSRPKYTELDPTLFFFVGFPLFYGLMLGDVGYGAVLLLFVFAGVFTRVFRFFGFTQRHALNRIFLHCALVSVGFGFLYGEFFGLELFGHEDGHAGLLSGFETHLGPIPFPLSRFHNVQLLLFLSLAVAAAHMLFGLVVGLRNAAQDHGWASAVKHRGSWLCILLAVALAGAAALPSVLGLHGLDVPHPSAFNFAAIGLVLLGVVLLVLAEGATGLLELPTVLSNLLSYTRLVAIGLSGVGIALAGNKVSELGFGAGGAVGILAGILILLFFHALNLALGVLGPALHSLRLHYVEFFTKFYEGGGEAYAPFGVQRKFTVKEVKQA